MMLQGHLKKKQPYNIVLHYDNEMKQIALRIKIH